MSMKECPASGYVVPVTALKKLIPEEFHKDFDSLLNSEDGIDIEIIENFLDKHLPPIFSTPEIFLPRDEDTMDGDMEYGIAYAIFDESELFDKQPKKTYLELKKLEIIPVFANWSIFCG